jgi:cold-inducible RNA-binding protein
MEGPELPGCEAADVAERADLGTANTDIESGRGGEEACDEGCWLLCVHEILEKKMKNLFVGNMSFQTTESELAELFRAFGQVTRVHIATDRETGRARGFAFVEMPNDDEAAKAITGLDGKELGGRNLKVSEARPKTERRPSRGGGDRNRGGFSHEDYRESSRQPREPRW